MSNYDTLRNMSFVEGDRTHQSDLVRLVTAIELERVTDLHDVTDLLNDMVDAIDTAMNASQEADDALEEIVDQGDVAGDLARRVEDVIRDLQFDDPDSLVLRDLTYAIRTFDTQTGKVVTFT